MLRLSRLQGKQVAPYLFILPNVILLSLFVAYPLFRAGLLSFQEWNILSGESHWVGLDNYQTIITDSVFWQSLRNTVFYTLGRVPLTMLLALAVALLLNARLPARGLLRGIYFFPTVTSMVVIALVWRFLFEPGQGLVTQVLLALGFTNLPNWLGDQQWALPIVILVSVWKGLGFSMVIFLAGLQAIPPFVYEAGRIDGANSWQLLRFITLPLLRPTTFFVLIVSVIDSFKVFDQVYVMTGGGPGYATMTMVQYIYRGAFQLFEMGQATAAAWVLFGIILALTVMQYKYFREADEG